MTVCTVPDAVERPSQVSHQRWVGRHLRRTLPLLWTLPGSGNHTTGPARRHDNTIAALDLATGRPHYRIRDRKRWRELLTFLQTLRAR